jgi:hypothetical protein
MGNCTPYEPGKYRSEDIIESIENMLPLPDPQSERRKKAEAIYKQSRGHYGNSEEDPTVILPGVEFPYEADRLIEDDEGNAAKEKDADGTFLLADLQRTVDKSNQIQRWVQRKTAKLTHYSKWADTQKKKGRPALDLTWGKCVEETGVLQPPSASE